MKDEAQWNVKLQDILKVLSSETEPQNLALLAAWPRNVPSKYLFRLSP